MANIQFSFANEGNLVEASNIRSSLIFDKSIDGNKRSNYLDKTILSIIIQFDGSCSKQQIAKTFEQRFHVSFNDSELNSPLSRLQENGLILIEENIVSATQKVIGPDFFEELSNNTQRLISNIIARANKMIGIRIESTSVVIESIRQALSVYFHLYGYSFFGAQDTADEDQTKNAISFITKGRSEKEGRALVTAIADTLQNPTSEERDTLNQWAKAFISSQVMNFDPTLRNFKATSLRGKKFVLDTDVVLNCITTNAKHSSEYKEMILKLRSSGCDLIIPEQVRNEIADHADAAIKRYRRYGENLKTLSLDILEGPGSNVFIEDFVKTIRNKNKESLRFMDYIQNIYCSDDATVLFDRLQAVFSEKELSNTIANDVINEELELLTDSINQRTIETEKAWMRTDEENRIISQTDATLYLSVRNKVNREKSTGILSYNYYLMTRTTRTIKCAKELGYYTHDVVCNPNTLITLLQGIGVVSSNEMSIINLFENPFLAYSASMIWDDIKPLLDAGAKFKDYEIPRLRHDFKVNLHNLMTAGTFEERAKIAEELRQDNYLFASEIADSAIREQTLQDKLNEANAEIEKKNLEIDSLKKSIKNRDDKQNTIKAKYGNIQKLKSNRSKKKRKK